MPSHDSDRRHRLHLPVLGTKQLPSPFMDEPVVTMTEERQVIEISGTAMCPVLDVMRRGPGRRAIAPWPLTSVMPSMERAARGPRRQPACTPNVDHRRVRTQQHTGDAGVACDALDGGRADRASPLEHPGGSASGSDQRVKGGGDLQVRTLTTHPG